MKLSYLFVLGSLVTLSAHAAEFAPVGAQCALDKSASVTKAKEMHVPVSTVTRFSLNVYEGRASGAMLLESGTQTAELVSFPDLFNFLDSSDTENLEKAIQTEITYTTHDIETYKININKIEKTATVIDKLFNDGSKSSVNQSVGVYKCSLR